MKWIRLTLFLLRDFDLALADDVERVPGRALPHDVRAASEVTLKKKDRFESDHADRHTEVNWTAALQFTVNDRG